MNGESISERTRPVHLLLVGPREEDFFLIRDLLAQHSTTHFELDHVLAAKDASERLVGSAYDLVILQQEAGNELVTTVLGALRGQDRAMPLLVLTEHADEHSLVAAVRGSFCEYVSRDELAQGSFLRTVRWANDLHRREQRFQETLQKLHSAVEQSADMVVITDVMGRIEYVNPAFERTTGYTRTEVIGSTPRILKSGEHNPAFYADLWRRLHAGEVFRGVMINRKKSGESLVVEKTITPVRNAQGVVTHFISNDRDISEVRRLETDLFQAHKMDAIGQLAGGVAHDFNNLLMVISSYAELMLDEIPPEHKLHRHLHEIMGASRRAADLTRQLLAFGRKQRQSLEVVDLNSVVQGILRFLPRLIGEDIELKVVPASELGRVRVDPGQIEQVLLNLAANARDAMPQGGILTIETRNIELDETYVHAQNLVRPGDYVLLEVTDSGTGIPPEHLPHIFEPFYTTKEQGKGTGLGLATVYGIVKQSGGYIWVYSEKNLGTAFKIYFPRVRKQSTPSHDERPIRMLENTHGNETILVVEDEQPVRLSLCECLRSSGYTVLDAGCGADALAIAKDHKDPLHLLISDVVMPGMSGWQLADGLSAMHPESKILFVSGYAEQVVSSRGSIQTRDGFLQKPFTLRALALKVREVLESQKTSATAGA